MNKTRKLPSVAWAWAAGWFLASLGLVISDAYSSPNRGLAAAYLLGLAGWGVGAAGTIRYMRQKFGPDTTVIAISAAGWVIGSLVAVFLGLFWGERWDPGILGPIVAAALGGAIGGGLTFPTRSLPSAWVALRLGLWGFVSWGAAFLVFQVLAFYASYILVQLTVNPLVPLAGDIGAKIPGWALPAGLGGLLAGVCVGGLSPLNTRGEAA